MKGSTDGPREGQLAAFADGVSGEYAASTFFAPCMYVGGDTRPEESLSDTMKGLVRAEVAGAGGGVVGSENGASQAVGDNNEKKAVVFGGKVLMSDEAIVG